MESAAGSEWLHLLLHFANSVRFVLLYSQSGVQVSVLRNALLQIPFELLALQVQLRVVDFSIELPVGIAFEHRRYFFNKDAARRGVPERLFDVLSSLVVVVFRRLLPFEVHFVEDVVQEHLLIVEPKLLVVY